VEPLPCIVCGNVPESALPDHLPPASASRNEPSQPYEATSFYSYGQYGSTAFDPQDQSQILVNVCDGCLSKAGTAGQVWHCRHVRQPALTVFSHPWDPDRAE
jgi:hypothetical protein